MIEIKVKIDLFKKNIGLYIDCKIPIKNCDKCRFKRYCNRIEKLFKNFIYKNLDKLTDNVL